MAEEKDFKQRANEVLARNVTDENLKKQLTDGSIDPTKELFLDLGISADRMKALAKSFNTIIKNFGKSPKRYVTSDDLGDCDTIKSLYELLAPSFP